MRNKLIIILIILLIILGIVYFYKVGFSGRARLKIRDYCHDRARQTAQEIYMEMFPEEIEKIEEGTYLREDYDSYYNQCLIEEGYY